MVGNCLEYELHLNMTDQSSGNPNKEAMFDGYIHVHVVAVHPSACSLFPKGIPRTIFGGIGQDSFGSTVEPSMFL